MEHDLTHPILRVPRGNPPRQLLGPLNQQKLSILIRYPDDHVLPHPRDLPQQRHQKPLVVDGVGAVRRSLDPAVLLSGGGESEGGEGEVGEGGWVVEDVRRGEGREERF